MKSNIDLTMDRDFSSPSGNRLETLEDLINRLDGNYPWSYVLKMNRNDSPKDELIITGDKERRNNKKKYGDFLDRDFCDRCGTKIDRYPWEGEATLCKRCEVEVLEQVVKRKPWNSFWSIDRILAMSETY